MRVRLLLFVCLALGLPRLLSAQTTRDPGDLARLSIEELLNVEVTSVSRKEERADTASAAVYVITQDDIRRSGIRSLPDLFRLVPGVQVAQVNASNWAISVRGFNDVYSNKLLVLIDGRSLYNRAFSGVFWNAEDLLLDDIDRIEVVRGPGGTVWGANAVNGVINIVTRSAYQTRGALVHYSLGTFDRNDVSLRYGGALGKAAYRVFTRYTDRDESVMPSGGVEAGDSSDVLTNGFRLDWEAGHRSFTIDGGFTAAYSHPLFTLLVSPLPEVPIQTDNKATRHTGYVLGRFTESLRNGATLQVQAFYNHRRVDDPSDLSVETVGDLDVEYRLRARERHDLVFGGGVRDADERNTGTFAYSLVPPASENLITNVFAQDEIALGRRVRATIGTKLEHDTVAGVGVQPSARLGWDIVPGRHRVWTAVSRALRTPSSIDLGAIVNYSSMRTPDGVPVVLSVQGNPHYQTEELNDFEAGYRAKLHSTFDIDVAAFRGHYTHLKSYEPQAPVVRMTPTPYVCAPLEFGNLLHAHTQGVEVAAHWTPLRIWRLDASYSGYQFDSHLDASSLDTYSLTGDGNAPAHQWQMHSALWLGQRAELNASLFHVGRLQNLAVPAFARADLRLEYKLSPRLSLIGSGQNLLSPSHAEYSPADIGMIATRVPRSASVQFVWRVGAGS